MTKVIIVSLSFVLLCIMNVSPIFAICTSDASVCPYREKNWRFDCFLSNKEKVLVIVDTATFSKKFFPYSNYNELFWGVVSEEPKNFIKKIDIQFKNKERWAPTVGLSAFSDLVNIHKVELIQIGDGFKLIIRGGDAAASYTAVLLFDKNAFLIERKVNSGEFPDEVWEKTVYSYHRDI